MAGLILCRSKYADKPYYISNMGIRINSMEELCYYIYHNIYLIGQDLVEDGLIDYIDRELEEHDLARQLSFLNSQNAGFSELMITILRHVDFYSNAEIEVLREIIEDLDRQNASERLKKRADSFLENRRYHSAIRNYEMILYGRKDPSLPMDFFGNVWHNMGVAYARMFDYKDAYSCFMTAYEMNEQEASLQAALSAAYFSGENSALEDDDQFYITTKEIETMMEEADEADALRPVKQALELRNEGLLPQYHEALDRLIENWKTEYKNYMK